MVVGAVASIRNLDNLSMGSVSGPSFFVVAIPAGYLGGSWVGAFAQLPSEAAVAKLRPDRDGFDRLAHTLADVVQWVER